MDPLLASALFGYPTSASRFDEAVDEAGVVRPVWRSLVATLARLGGAEVEQRRRQADRLIAAQGASYLYHDDADVERGRGGSTPSPSSSRPRTGSRWPRGSRSGPACSTPSSPTSTAIAACWRAWCRRRPCSAPARTSGPS